MDKFFELTCAPMCFVFAGLELALFVFLLIKYLKKKDSLIALVGAITFGLFYDALMIGLGVFIDPTKIAFIHCIRYYLHVLLIPLLIVIVSKALNVNKKGMYIFHIAATILIVIGIVATILTKYKVETLGGLTRLVADKDLTPTWAFAYTIIISVVPTLVLIIAGIIVWIKKKTPYVCLSGAFMYLFTLLTQGSAYGFHGTMYGELLMVIFLTLYIYKNNKALLK